MPTQADVDKWTADLKKKNKAQPKAVSKADVLRPVAKTRPQADVLRPTEKTKRKAQPGRTMYDTPRSEPTYNDSYFWQEVAPDRPDYGRGFARGLPATATNTGTRTTTAAQMPEVYIPPIPPQQRPPGLNPPASTGPIISPQGEVRARTAAAFNYSDEARRNLAQIPIQWGNAEPGAGGAFYHPPWGGGKGHVELPPGNPANYHLPMAAHEFSHQRWFEELGAETPQGQADFMADTNALAQQGAPFANNALRGWRTWHEENPNFYGQTADNPIPTEIHAGIAGDVRNPADMPDWYREKWYPGVYNSQTEGWRPMQKARFDNELPRPVFLGDTFYYSERRP
jgi:hypothetical protein